MRTIVDLDPLVLAELKKLQAVQGKSLGELISELLAPVLVAPATPPYEFAWPTSSMEAQVNIDDKDAVWSRLEQR